MQSATVLDAIHHEVCGYEVVLVDPYTRLPETLRCNRSRSVSHTAHRQAEGPGDTGGEKRWAVRYGRPVRLAPCDDDDCMALFLTPKNVPPSEPFLAEFTFEELRVALLHLKEHQFNLGCAHGC